MDLFSHQLTGSSFLAERGFAFLWDVPGLGKTATTIRACDLVEARKVLVICPAVVRRHWEDQFSLWAGFDRRITVEEGFVSLPPKEGITIVSHACLADVPPEPRSRARRREMYSFPILCQGAPYDVIIVDEADSFRDINAIRARNLWLPDGGLWTAARQVWALTGTPVVNSAADLWLPAYGPLRLPLSWWDWCVRYAELKPDAYQGYKPIGIRDPEGLATLIRPHALRRTIASVGIELPPLTITTVPVALPAVALEQANQELEGWTPARLAALMEAGRELQDAAIARVRHSLGIAKVELVAEHVRQILNDNAGPVVVFFHHTDVRKALFEILAGFGHTVSWIDGKITLAQLRAAREWFQAGKIEVLLVQTQAGGVGLTLHRSNRVVIAELPWTGVALHQAIARLHRIGQTRPVVAEILQARGCWLEDVLATVVSKKHRASESLLNLLTTDY